MGLVNPVYSIIVPIYNNASSIPELINVLNNLLSPSAELVLIDDGSKDDSWDVICHYSQPIISVNLQVRGVRMDKNRGQQSAILSALTTCRNKAVITMDDDLAHPAQLIPQLLKALEDGADLAFALPPRRPGSPFRRIFSRLHQIHMSIITGSLFSIRVGSFRAISPSLIDRILNEPLTYPYFSAQALSLRPAPKIQMVNSPPFANGDRRRFSPSSLIQLEYKLAVTYGPLSLCRNLFRAHRESPAADTGVSAAGWIAEVSG